LKPPLSSGIFQPCLMIVYSQPWNPRESWNHHFSWSNPMKSLFVEGNLLHVVAGLFQFLQHS
jgi:hypothetical protein